MIHTLRLLKQVFTSKKKTGRILFVGQAYYNAWYLSRELRKLNWSADLINYDESTSSQIYYHGEDFVFNTKGFFNRLDQLFFYFVAAFFYDVFAFANMGGIKFGNAVPRMLPFLILKKGAEIKFLKLLGKRIIYANNACQDGVSQESFSKWLPYNVCQICSHKNEPHICSNQKNLKWGKFRNELADFQITLGGNRKDYNNDPRVHEVPQFYCLDKNLWRPDMLIPSNYILPYSKSSIKLYHAVGNYEVRNSGDSGLETIKSTHIYIPLINKLKSEGFDVELIFFHDIPNKKIRYYQAQADIFLDMLTFGFIGASVREAMMLGKPAICYLRPEWLDSMRVEIPDYVDELPVVTATPETVYDILKDLVRDHEKRREIGVRSRKFAEKWHASDVAAHHFNQLLTKIITGEKLDRIG